MRCERVRRWAIGWLCAASILPPALRAADWSARPWADARVEYSDNIQLRSGHVQDTTGGVMNAGVRLRRADERGYINLAPSLRSTRYDSTEPLDSNDQDVKGAWDHRGERGEWRMDAQWTRDSTLTSELEVSGLIQARKRRLQRYLSPSYSHMLSPRATIAADIAYTTVKYGDALFTGLVDYDYARADLSMSYQWSEHNTVTGTFYGTRLEAARIDNRTDTRGLQLRLNSEFGARWDGSLGGGAYRNRSSSGGTGKNGWLIDLTMRRKDEKGEWRVGVNRGIDPSGTGVLVQRDQWSVAREQKLNDDWRLSASGYWLANKDLQSLATKQGRRFRSGSLSLNRRLTSAWRMNAAYFYAWQRYSGAANQAERNTVMLSIHYEGSSGAE